MSTVDDYIATVLPYARQQSQRTGIPVSVMLAQSGDETGWGTSQWWQQHLNPAGIGVTGKPGAGNTYSSVAAAFSDYADKLLGHGEAGQQQFANDVAGGADDLTLLRDLEAAPWAAGHYGGHGLETLWQQNNLGQYDDPNAAAPAAGSSSTPTSTGTGVAVQTAGSKSFDWNPLSWPGALIGDLFGGVKKDVATVVFAGLFLSTGLTLVVLGAWRTVGKEVPKIDPQQAAMLAAVAA